MFERRLGIFYGSTIIYTENGFGNQRSGDFEPPRR